MLKPGGVLLLTMDVRVAGEPVSGDFHVDREGAVSMLTLLPGLPRRTEWPPPNAASINQGKTAIAALMVRWVKPK